MRRRSLEAPSSRDIEAEIRRAAPYNSDALKLSRNSPPKRGASLNTSTHAVKGRKASESIPEEVASFLKRDASLEGLSKEPQIEKNGKDINSPKAVLLEKPEKPPVGVSPKAS